MIWEIRHTNDTPYRIKTVVTKELGDDIELKLKTLEDLVKRVEKLEKAKKSEPL